MEIVSVKARWKLICSCRTVVHVTMLRSYPGSQVIFKFHVLSLNRILCAGYAELVLHIHVWSSKRLCGDCNITRCCFSGKDPQYDVKSRYSGLTLTRLAASKDLI